MLKEITDNNKIHANTQDCRMDQTYFCFHFGQHYKNKVMLSHNNLNNQSKITHFKRYKISYFQAYLVNLPYIIHLVVVSLKEFHS